MLQADPENYGVADPYIGHLHKPSNTIVLAGRDFKALHHTDGLGFRNTWPWPDRAEIVVIGDSVTFGYGVVDDEAWPIPGGTAGIASAGHEPRLDWSRSAAVPAPVRRFGLKLRLKLLLVGVFPQNDFGDFDAIARYEEIDCRRRGASASISG